MAANRRSTIVAGVSVILALTAWVAVIGGVLSTSSALWITMGIALLAFVAAKFNRHAELPGSVRLH